MLDPACSADLMWRSMTAHVLPSWLRALAVTAGRDAASGGKSHSCVTATTSSPAPIAYRISVALGSSDTTRAGGVSCRIWIGGTGASMPHRAERPRRGCHRAGALDARGGVSAPRYSANTREPQ